METLKLLVGYSTCIFIIGIEVALLWAILSGKIDLKALLSERTGEASMSRFQLLIFTFVVALSLFLVVVAKNDFPDVPGSVLSLLGISGSSYLVSKGIQLSDSDKAAGQTAKETPAPPPENRP